MCDDKCYLTLNIAELLPNIRDNQQFLRIFTHNWQIVNKIWHKLSQISGHHTDDAFFPFSESLVKLLGFCYYTFVELKRCAGYLGHPVRHVTGHSTTE
jgi:hypothetical protein